MKKTALIVLLLLFPLMLLSAVDENIYERNSSISRILTAYKSELSYDVPAWEVNLRISDATGTEFDDSGHEINVPGNYRSANFGAFSWFLSGNVFEGLNLRITFGQLCRNGVQTAEKREYIPYEVRLVYGSSRIGNSPIQMDSYSTAQTYVSNTYSGTAYRFFYADSITNAYESLNDAVAVPVAASPVPVLLEYNMKPYTKVANSSGSFGNNNEYRTAYVNAVKTYVDDQGVTQTRTVVCDHWNRTGTAYFKLLITDDSLWSEDSPDPGIELDNGKFSATITVEVSLND